MRVLMQVGLLAVLVFLGFAGGGMVGAQFVPAGSGLAGGATVFLWAVGGAVAGVAAAVAALRRLSARAQRGLFLWGALAVVIILVWMGTRIVNQAV